MLSGGILFSNLVRFSDSTIQDLWLILKRHVFYNRKLSMLLLQSPSSRQEADGKTMIFQVCVSIFENIFRNSTQAVQFLVH